MNISITTTYTLTHQIIDTDYYISNCGKCFNIKKGIEIRQVLNSGCKGYCINGKFQSLNKLRGKLIKINKQVCPF